MSANADGTATKRVGIVQDIAARTGIDDPMIERVVRAFYDRVARDPLLAPVFAMRISEWEPHLKRMCDFWSSVALMSGRYHGQPMAAHWDLPIDTSHFDRWLELFAATVAELCPAEAARHFLERAYRIADSLEWGIAARNGDLKSRPKRRPPQPPAGLDVMGPGTGR